MEVRVLGPLLVLDGGIQVDLGPKERVLLARLVAARGHDVPVDVLVDVLWGDRPPATARKTLQGHVHRIRRAMGPAAIVSGDGTYRLAASIAVDVAEVEELIDEGRQAAIDGRTDKAAQHFDAARVRFRGHPLADLDDDPTTVGLRQYLGELELTLEEERLRNELRRGRANAVVGELERLVARDPTRERAWYLLTSALASQGRQREALDAVGRARRALAIELGLEPSANLKELEQAILEQREMPWVASPAVETFAPPRAPEPTAPTGAAGLLGAAPSSRRPATVPPRLLTYGLVLFVLAGVAVVVAVVLVDPWRREQVEGGEVEASPPTATPAPPTEPATVPATTEAPATTDPPAPTTTIPRGGQAVDPNRLRVGMCIYRLPALPGQDDLDRRSFEVACSQPHHVEFLHRVDLGGSASPYPGETTVVSTSDRACRLAFADYVGTPYERSGLEYVFVYPSEPDWLGGRRRSTCWVTASVFDGILDRPMQGSRL